MLEGGFPIRQSTGKMTNRPLFAHIRGVTKVIATVVAILGAALAVVAIAADGVATAAAAAATGALGLSLHVFSARRGRISRTPLP